MDFQIPGTNIRGGKKKNWIHIVEKYMELLKTCAAKNRKECCSISNNGNQGH